MAQLTAILNFTLLMTAFLLTSCCSESDFVIPKEYRALLNKYSAKDTLYYINSKNDMDTILITKIDSFQHCGTPMGGERKEITVEIEHLPNNKWTEGTEMYQDRSTKVLNQKLLIIEKRFVSKPKDKYYVLISYRDFYGTLEDINKIKEDTLLSDLGINKYWLINNDNQVDRGDSTSITKILWTTEYGLTGYYKRVPKEYGMLGNYKPDSDLYKIKTAKSQKPNIK